MRNFARRCALITSFDLREFIRQRPSVSIFLQPLLFLGFVMVLPGVLGTAFVKIAPPTVAVEGSSPAAVTLTQQLRDQHVRVTRSGNAVAAARNKRASLGLIIHDDASVRVIVARTREKSRTAFGALEAALARVGAVRAGATPLKIETTRVELSKTPHGQELTFSRFLPFYILGQLISVLGLGITHFAGSAAKRATEPLLVLPFRRVELAVGKAGFSASTGLMLLAGMFIPLAIFIALPFAVAGVNVAMKPWAFAALVLGALTLLPVLGAAGVLLGSAARTPNQANVISALTGIVPLAIAGALTFVLHGVLPNWVLPIPLVGHFALLAEAARAAAPWWHFAVVLVASFAWAALFLVPAGRLLTRDRMVLRPAD